GAQMDAADDPVIEFPTLAEFPFQKVQGSFPEVLARKNAQSVRLFRGDLPHSMEFSDVKAFQELEDLLRVHGLLTVGFVDVTGHLGDEFVDGDSGGGRQAGAFQDFLSDLPGDQGGRRVPFFIVADIQIGLVQGKGLHQIGVLVKDFLNGLGNFPITVEPGGNKDQLGEVSKAIQKIFYEYTDLVEPLSLD